MENFTKNSLKAAVKAYGPLHTEGKTADEVKQAIVADERAFTAEQVDEIYEAITAEPEEEQAKEAKTYIVLTQFADINNFDKRYEVGDDVSHFDADRLASLVDRKLVEAK